MAKASKILVDTDALVAIAKKDDSNHLRALSISTKIKNATLYVTPFTIPEAATVISHKVSQKDAILFLQEARRKRLFEVVLNPEIVRLTDETFSKQKRKGTSWVDCLNVAVVKSLDLQGIFSFDKFYKRLDIRTFPS